jgi:hypothetical protein
VSVKSRQTKLFAALFFSMTTVSLLLMALGSNPPSAGAFCLDSYYALEPVHRAVSSHAAQYRGRWDTIEIYCAAESDVIKQSPSPDGADAGLANDFHFRICNGSGGKDGQIQTSERWRRQWSVDPSRSGLDTFTGPDRSNERTIRICIMVDDKSILASDYQIRRVDTLVEALCRTFEIAPECVHYPSGWR